MQDDARRDMSTGVWYSCLSDELEAMRRTARRACHEHNTMDPDARGACAPYLAALCADIAPDAFIEAPFHCSYGVNLHVGAAAYLNAGCVVLDSAPVRIGAYSMLGPGVHIYCADHHRDVSQRRAGVERALPVTIGTDVWIGGGAILLPGARIGDGAIVAAGAVVRGTVSAGSRVAGIPARAL
ncbi:MAG: maltose acetyltransferase [Confluentimicrobium sp.]|jgi:maltose O-acetyltransferase|uniref:sugar O-acetyltransferase n=1 Tax=Actibacterium sp. TaxID=1872125 RepID=UPI000C67E71A|nr:sugar O-acetyltransferase [Actibacterium sp.]MBC58392.1 maltose acetyltransferase [Actibacterium sp.]|tara:strand:- start:2991 stop:3539 length:549 start_codon:yes stop_codon:yes gene_type:complete